MEHPSICLNRALSGDELVDARMNEWSDGWWDGWKECTIRISVNSVFSSNS